MSMLQRKWLFALGLMGWLLAFSAAAMERNTAVEVPLVEDLRIESKQAERQNVAILLMFGAEHCGYCIRVEEEFLKPMIISGHYTDKVLIRRINLDSFDNIRDFEGKKVSPYDLAERYEVGYTPTIVFLDASGNQLAGKMVGLTTPDYYGGYLDQAIDTSVEWLRRSGPTRIEVSVLEQ